VDEPHVEPLLYGELAGWFHLLTAPEEYAEEAAFHERALVEHSARTVRTVLELGSGGGNNASHMKRRFEMTLADRSPEMLGISRSINPECEHVEGDMRTLRLGRSFDAVFVHDAVAYITTAEDLLATMRTAFVHCEPGGAALFVPDAIRETFEPSADLGGHDGIGDDRRALRYLEWTWDPDPDDCWFVVDFAYLLREPGAGEGNPGRVRVVHDRHVCGVFPRATWLALLREAGFEPMAIEADYDGGGEAFIGRRPFAGAATADS
jgi:SAM-dependent methyltransferase